MNGAHWLLRELSRHGRLMRGSDTPYWTVFYFNLVFATFITGSRPLNTFRDRKGRLFCINENIANIIIHGFDNERKPLRVNADLVHVSNLRTHPLSLTVILRGWREGNCFKGDCKPNKRYQQQGGAWPRSTGESGHRGTSKRLSGMLKGLLLFAYFTVKGKKQSS